MQSSQQIFQTQKTTRWQRFKWGSRIILFLTVIAIAITVIALNNTFQPDLPVSTRVFRKVVDENAPAYKESEIARQYSGFRKFIDDQWAKGKGCGQFDSSINLSKSHLFNDSIGIRAAFYVDWDAQSYFSLKRNIAKLNLVIPEWFFLDPIADTLIVRIDKRGYNLIKTSGVSVMPMLTNNVNGQFRGDILHRILNDENKQQQLVNSIEQNLIRYGFKGINIDFEELIEPTNEKIIAFQQKLYNQLHAKNLLVTQDVIPFNEDYPHKELAAYNDYLILMAYDQHTADTKPGPLCTQQWIEAAIDNIAKDIPSSKIIIGLGGHGYDWNTKDKQKTTTVTYQEALTIARESEGKVIFDNHTYNLHYSYYDEYGAIHEVHFTDAATHFNIVRFATEYGLAGAALWRLGNEDSRVWEYYDKPMSKAYLKTFSFKDFNKVESSNDVDYIGEGEILEVLSTPRQGHITVETDTSEMLISEQKYDSLPSMFVVKKWGKVNGKKLVLTFDDGPDPLYTRQILDTLSFYKVTANFFVVGIQAEKNIPLLKRIYKEGHEISNHTFTHTNMATVSKNRAFLEMDLTQLLIESITGHSTTMFRAPFNADSEPETMEELIPVALSKERGYITVGENIDPNDWEVETIPDFNADSILNRTIRYAHRGNIILLHDAGGDRSETVKATGKIIRYFKAQGYEFVTVAQLLGKNKVDVMPPVPEEKGVSILRFFSVLAEIGYWGGQIFFSLFLTFLFLGCTRLTIMFFLAMKEKLTKQKQSNTNDFFPPITIIVPTFNEEINIIKTINSLLQLDYLNYSIIIVDDGSKDATTEILQANFTNHPIVKIYTKLNGGKASALNYGIQLATTDFVVCIDADTQLHPQSIKALMLHFQNEKIGAVAGNVKVGNAVNLLTLWQSIEYITSQNFDRLALSQINGITVVPGAIGAFRKQAIINAGGFTTDTLAEDCDLTIRILRSGYIVKNESKALAYTEVPEKLRQFMKQRFRWTFGVMQSIWKNKQAFFSIRFKALGWLALPNIVLFKYFIPLFTPFADLLLLIGLFFDNTGKIGQYYLLFTIIDMTIAAIAFLFEKENPLKILLIIPQRLVYRWLLLVVLYKSFIRALKGELQSWGILKRSGNVQTSHIAG